MKSVILCGGQGSRIRDVSEAIPKPMLPIGGRPILWHIMKNYAVHGVQDFVLCLGYKGYMIRDFFLNYRARIADVTLRLGDHGKMTFHDDVEEAHWNVTLADTGEDTMTGARVRAIKRYVQDDDLFCVTYGDGVADVDISALVEHHRASGLIATLTAVRVAGRFGELATDKNIITEFNEKPAVTAGRINGGFFVFDAKRVWDYFDDDPYLVLEGRPLARLVKDRQLGVYEHGGFWQCMDTLREYNQLNHLWEQERALWKTWE